MHLTFAVLATVLSALFFVGGKLVLVRGTDWRDLWTWSLSVTGLCGLVAWLSLGLPMAGWHWCLAAGLAGSAAHVAANLGMRWGEASVLVPISGAKPIVLIPLAPLFTGAALPPGLTSACLLATVGLVLVSLSPHRSHVHALRPGTGILLMGVAMLLMALSDLCGARGLAQAGAEGRFGAIALWNLSLGLVPTCSAIAWRRPRRGAGMPGAIAIGVVFAAFISCIAAAFATAPDPLQAVATVNVLIALRGALAVVLVVAIDRTLGLRMEPVPLWVHGLRLAGAGVLAWAVLLAYG